MMCHLNEMCYCRCWGRVGVESMLSLFNVSSLQDIQLFVLREDVGGMCHLNEMCHCV